MFHRKPFARNQQAEAATATADADWPWQLARALGQPDPASFHDFALHGDGAVALAAL